jgi:3',5'-cyclic AMP phosphodiesterase CpdA
MAWAGTGLLWTMAGGVPTSRMFAATADAVAGQTAAKAASGFSFVQISDSHIGFNKAANQDVTGTLKAAIDKINALPGTHDLLLHTGDITHSSKPAEFDTAQQMLKEAKSGQVFYVPGEHDTASDDGAMYLERFGKGTLGSGWYSFNHKGVHFVGLNNSQQIDALGKLGTEQLAWLKNDLAGLSASTPIVVFAHIPLWMVYPDWGWGTQDGAEALSYLNRFGSVTVLNGHIHQVVQKVEGNVSFHTAMSTAFPQPAPGTAPHAGPMVVPAGRLSSVLGITEVKYLTRNSHLAIVDSSLAENA